MKKIILGLLLTTTILAGCSSSPIREPASYDNTSVVYLWLNTDDTFMNRTHRVIMKQYQPRVADPEWHMHRYVLNKGILAVHYGLENGLYKLDRISQNDGQDIMHFQLSNYDIGKLRIEKQGIYYVGAYDLDTHKGEGLFDAPTFTIDDADSKDRKPSEKEALEVILANMPENQPGLKARIEKRLAELK